MGRVLETLRDVGKLSEGDVQLGRARYDITIYQKTHTVRTFGGTHEIDGLKTIEGYVTPFDANLFDLVSRGAPLTLELADGRRWEFFVSNTDGRAVNRGGLH
jgi:hypothetical protein